MRRKVALITGAGGFIGSNLTRKLIREQFNVHVIVKKTSSLERLQDVKQMITPHYSDLSDEKKLQKILIEISPHFIFHLATFENYRDQTKLTDMIQTNIIGTKNLLFASANLPYTCFVNTGSSSEYGLKRKPMKESDVLEPLSYYAVTKSSSTLLCQAFAKLYKKPIVTFRLFSVYGPYETDTRFIPTAIRAAIQNNPLPLTEGKICRDFIYVDDVINAYIKVCQKKYIHGEIFNIGTGKQFSNEDVVRYIEKISQKKLDVERNKFPRRLWDTDYWVADISKSKKDLGWSPKNTLEQGLKKTYSYYKNLYTYV